MSVTPQPYHAETSAKIVAEHGLSESEYAVAVELMGGKAPNMLELGIFSVMWSEHCSYKSSKKWLKTLPTEGPQVICGPGENAGIIDIGDGQAAVFKIESHNHPSYIEPYQGAATGVGGILRDVFTMGARPIANLNALRFGDPKHPKSKHLVNGVIAGIGGYGNCIGVPTVAGETNFDPAYNGNVLVNAMTIGLADADKIFYSAASGLGNPVVYVGAKTGRDGIHGATMASTEFDEGTEAKRPTVQVGDPFKEKCLLEACLELMATDAILAIQDMGAAGLTSSSFEMASKGGSGIEMWLDKVPQRETNMTPYEMMLSESQERMLMVIKPGREDQTREIFEKWDLDFAVVGTITDTGRMVLQYNGEMVGDLPIDPLALASPEYDRPWVETKPVSLTIDTSKAPQPLDALVTMIGGPHLSSRRWIWEQYDHMVMTDTIQRPGGDAAVTRIHGSNKGLASTVDCTPRYCLANPALGGAQAVAESFRNLCAVGAKPLAITNNLNFGNPEKPEIMGQIVGAVKGMGAAALALDTPVVSGNVSLYNETDGQPILPTPVIGAVGLMPNVSKMATVALKRENDDLVLIGAQSGNLAGSLYARDILGQDGGTPELDLGAERTNGDFIRELIAKGDLDTVHDVADGGVLVAATEMALASMGSANEIGLELAKDFDNQHLFAEDQASYVVSTPYGADLVAKAKAAGVPALLIGKTGGSQIKLGDASVDLQVLSTAHEDWFPTTFG